MATNNALNKASAPFTVTGNVLAGGLSFDAGTTVMATYEYNTFTPTVTFNGGNTGITYSAQTGTYWRIGKVVHFNITITLTNKGSSTGVLRVESLPYTPAVASYCSALLGYVTVTADEIQAEVSTSNYILFEANTANNADIFYVADTHCANGTKIRCTGSYFVA